MKEEQKTPMRRPNISYRWFSKLCLFGLLLSSLALPPLIKSPVQAQEPTEPLRIPAGEMIRVGLATDLSNILPAPGLDMAQAAQLAITQFNQRGGLLGFEVELVIEDDLCTPDGAEIVADSFIRYGDITAVVGHLCSGASIVASHRYQRARIPMMSISTADSFTDQGLDVANRIALNDNIQGVVAARYIFKLLNLRQIIVLHDSSSYGEGLAETVAETFQLLGGRVLLFEGIASGEVDASAEALSRVADQHFDLVYFGGYDRDAAYLREQLHALGLDDVLLFSGDGVYNLDYLDFVRTLSEGTFVTFPRQVGDPGANAAFHTAYEAEYGISANELGPYHAQAYDAANLILIALQRSAVLDEDGSLLIDRETLIKNLRGLRRVRGLTGLISCDERGECGAGRIAVYQAQDGRWHEMPVPPDLQLD